MLFTIAVETRSFLATRLFVNRRPLSLLFVQRFATLSLRATTSNGKELQSYAAFS
ncbi:MAG: hypothetical protein ACYDER_02905 [Ktedonobacteraceae bacterium]